ncbi:MAG: hypothetical protein P8J86_06320 [Phycisphaerales bacterium]|nr:hypothetical protein [Phycisphaerales bacterium]
MNFQLEKLSLAICLSTTLLISTSTFGQATAPESQPSESTNDSLLSGPQVEEDTRTDGREMSNTKRNRSQRTSINLRIWMGQMLDLDLTATQRKELGEMMNAYQSKMRVFQAENGAKIRKLSDEVRAMDESDPERPAIFQALQQARKDAPKAEAYQEQAMALLSDAQRDIFREKIAEAIATQQRQKRQRSDQSPSNQNMSEGMSENMQNMNSQNRPGSRESDLDERARRAIRFLRAHQAQQDGDESQPSGSSNRRDRRDRRTAN